VFSPILSGYPPPNPSQEKHKLGYYPKKGSPVLIEIPYVYNADNPVNIIFAENAAFYRFDPVTKTRTFLCKIPDYKKDAMEWIRKYEPGLKADAKQLKTNIYKLRAGNIQGDFIIKIHVNISEKSSFCLNYFYSIKAKKLTGCAQFKLKDGSPVNLSHYATYDDRYIFIEDNNEMLLDTNKPELIDIGGSLKNCKEHIEYSPDLKYAAVADLKDIVITDLKTGSKKLIYRESRQDAHVSGFFWFPPENSLVVTIRIERSLGSYSVNTSEILLIDPFKGTTRQISAPCPYYKYGKNKYFNAIYEFSGRVKPAADWIDGILGIK
jgi:hypothetical protein